MSDVRLMGRLLRLGTNPTTQPPLYETSVEAVLGFREDKNLIVSNPHV
jgi:hypothetical protein